MIKKARLLLFACALAGVVCTASGQEVAVKLPGDTVAHRSGVYSPFHRNTVMATFSFGFFDLMRAEYEVPAGFEKNHVNGFAPVYGLLEYGLNDQFGIGVAFSYDVYRVNYYRLYTTSYDTFRRSYNGTVKIFSGNLFLAYHLHKLLAVKNLDPFVTAGIGTNTITYDRKPQGDSVANLKEYLVTPYVRAGVRYYFAEKGSVFADAGYDGKACVSVGFSCRFR